MGRMSGSTDSKPILVGLMETDGEGAGYLSPGDLAALLLHQLRTPVRLEVEGSSLSAQLDRLMRDAFADRPALTFGDVLESGERGDRALRAVKEFAKAALKESAGLPEPVAHFLYVAAVLRASTVDDSTVSTLDEDSRLVEARRLLTAGWLPERARDLLRANLPA